MVAEERDSNRVSVGNVQDISGEVNIAGGDIHKGYTAEQVSVLIKQISSTFQPKPFDGRSPYKGLDVFEEEDAGLFFGREKIVDDLAGRVRDSRAVFITGPSGSGKSSLVRAGLIHTLKEGAIKNSEHWLYATMKPGREPITALARAVAGLVLSTNAEDEICAKAMTDETIFARWCEIALKEGSDKRLVLFIDQFEEIFTQISKEEERVAFLNLLSHAVTVEGGRVSILFAMRSDFVSNCATYPKLNALLNQQFVQIGAMQSEELVSAIAQPALRVGLRIDPDLIAQIINDMHGEPGALPLMQFALKDLFDAEQAKGGIIALTLDDYLQRGGIRKSLERHADDAFSKLNGSEQELARSIFSGLIEIGRGTVDTRRTALFDELIPANADAEGVKTVIRELADARLITTDEQAGKETVTISHEKLIDAWPWLKKLVNENRDVIALQNEIATDAKEWEDHKRDGSYLYSGARLANSREQLESKRLVLNGLALEFVVAARARQRRGQLATIAGISAIILFLVLAVVIFNRQAATSADTASTAQAASTFAIEQRGTAQANANAAATAQSNAEEQARITRAGELAARAEALINTNYPVSLLLGIESLRLSNDVRTRSTVLDALDANARLLEFLGGHTGIVDCITFSPDGRKLASGGNDGAVILWDVATGKSIGQPLVGNADPVRSLAFSPDGMILAAGGDGGIITLWDVGSHQPTGQPLSGGTLSISGLAFSTDGEALVSGDYDGTINVWNVASGKAIGHPPKGRLGQIGGFALTTNGKTVAVSDEDGSITLWDVATGEPAGQPLIGHTGPVRSLAFSPDGEMLASGSIDGTVILWSMTSGNAIGQPLPGATSGVFGIAFGPDSKTLVAATGSTVLLWDTGSHQAIGRPLSGSTSAVSSVAFSSDGKTIAAGNGNGIVLWNVASRGALAHTLATDAGGISSVAFGPDGRTLVSGSDEGTIILRNVATGNAIGQPLTSDAGGISSVTFSPDGTILASVSDDGTAILWNVATGKVIGRPLMGQVGEVRSTAFSQDGKTLAASSADDFISLWDVTTSKAIGRPFPGNANGDSSMALSPDGKTLASGDYNGSIILWDVGSGNAIGQPLAGGASGVFGVAISPDGLTLASGSDDGIIRLWDIGSHQAIGQPLIGLLGSVRSVAFSPDGKTLASGSDDGTIVLWDVDPQSWITRSCQRVGRNFTPVEWKEYGFTEPYRATCPQWPLDTEAVQTPSTTASPTP